LAIDIIATAIDTLIIYADYAVFTLRHADKANIFTLIAEAAG